jgi:uncharacterized protein YecT (DUF1311 family)
VLFILSRHVAQIHAQTQPPINEARADFVNADADLNTTYQTVVTNLPDMKAVGAAAGVDRLECVRLVSFICR